MNFTIKIHERTKELIVLGANIEAVTIDEFVDRAVRHYLRTNRETIQKAFKDIERLLDLI